MQQNLDKSFWNQRWQTGQTGWDIGYASPAIVDYFKNVVDKYVKILIPGCGNAYEAEALYDLGFRDITILDISDEALLKLNNKFEHHDEVKIVCQNFFDHHNKYDFIVEQTFFCALHPNLRKDYVDQMHNLLHKNGKLVGLLFDINFDKDGPPFGGSEAQYKLLFKDKFELLHLEKATNSIPQRQGNELFIEFKAK